MFTGPFFVFPFQSKIISVKIFHRSKLQVEILFGQRTLPIKTFKVEMLFGKKILWLKIFSVEILFFQTILSIKTVSSLKVIRSKNFYRSRLLMYSKYDLS